MLLWFQEFTRGQLSQIHHKNFHLKTILLLRPSIQYISTAVVRSVLVQRHHVTYGATGPCHVSGNQSLAFHCKSQSSIADQSMWTSGWQSGSETSRPSTTSVFLFQYHSTTAPYSNFIHHRHHKILPTHSTFTYLLSYLLHGAESFLRS